MTIDLTPRTWTIYQIRCSTSGSLYIGQTCQTLNDRWKRHCSLAKAGHTSRLSEAIRLHGPSSFEGVEIVQVGTQAEADEWETLLIASHPRSALYNEQAGGNSGVPLTAEAERKRRKGVIECSKSPEWRATVAEAQRLRWAAYTPEQRAARGRAISEGKRAKKCA